MNMLEIKQLKKSFLSPDGEKTLIIDIDSFQVKAGEQVAIHGFSGSGKSTLLHLIAGILEADAGSILLENSDIARLSEGERDRVRADNIGYMFQTFNLLQGYTALENVILGMSFGGEGSVSEARTLLEKLGLGDRLNHKPRQLSVGQQQRVAVARALVKRPKLVLADEPTGNLDFHHAREALKLMRDICEEAGSALLLVSHDSAILDEFKEKYELSDINKASVSGRG